MRQKIAGVVHVEPDVAIKQRGPVEDQNIDSDAAQAEQPERMNTRRHVRIPIRSKRCCNDPGTP